MSLRRDFHDAYDEIAPPLGGMPERVVQTVLSDKQRRKRGMTFRARMPLPLVAAFAAVALIAAALIGNQLVSAWIAAHGPSPAASIHLTAVQELEARPLRIQTFASAEACPTAPPNAEGSVGTGPLYGGNGSASTTSWGEYFYLNLYTDTVIAGPMLVRARDALKPATVAFAGPFAAGPTMGTDLVDGKRYTRHSELVLDENRALATALPGWGTEHHRFVWDFLAGIPAGSNPGTTGFQIDGAGFTEVFYTC